LSLCPYFLSRSLSRLLSRLRLRRSFTFPSSSFALAGTALSGSSAGGGRKNAKFRLGRSPALKIDLATLWERRGGDTGRAVVLLIGLDMSNLTAVGALPRGARRRLVGTVGFGGSGIGCADSHEFLLLFSCVSSGLVLLESLELLSKPKL
jgi:hypothetical protein